MTLTQLITIWTDYAPLSIAIWLSIIIAILYCAKTPIHGAIRSLCVLLHDGLVQMAEAVVSAEGRLKERNKEVLLAEGMEAVENDIEREFYRVNTIVERDLSGFPVLKRQLLEQIAKIDEDYQQSSDMPPSPPEWIAAVESLAKLPQETTGSKTIANMLKEIHKTTASQHKSAMEEYRKAVASHHTSLNKLMPYWRKLKNTLDVVGRTITGLQERTAKIDKKMDDYENILSKNDTAQRILSSSSITQFFISGLVLAIAVAGIFINFNLIALPMSEMVGGGSRIGGFRTSEVAALVIILVEVAIGLYLMESLRFTRLFPVIGQMDDKKRKWMIWITLGFLIILAGIESSLALMRDQIAANNQALLQTLAGESNITSANTIIPTIGQMILGFVLPFILTFVAIPLESFIHSSRTVFGVLLAFALRAISFMLNISGEIIMNAGELLVNVYDIIIFPPLWVEEKIYDKLKLKTKTPPPNQNLSHLNEEQENTYNEEAAI